MPTPLDFPNPPLTVGQTWAGTNGTTYTWDGAVWTATAASGGGGSGGGPPTGPAGGDLTGTYPNPTVGPLAVGNAEISDVAWGKVTGAPTIPTTLPPSGAAGGDLTGTYPNPTVGPLAVGNAEISDLAYSKLTGAPAIPTTLPPSGPAGGALSGTYPNPGVVYSAITGTPTSLPPSGTAGGALTGTYPNPGVSYAAITGTPTALPPSGAAGGDLTGTYPNPTHLTVGAQVQSSTFPTIPHATFTDVSFDTVVVNRGSAWSAGTPTRITLGVTGVYLVGAAISWSPNATGARIITIQNKANAMVIRSDSGTFGSGANTAQVLAVLYVVTDPTDYVHLSLWQNSGAGLALSADPPLLYAWRLAT